MNIERFEDLQAWQEARKLVSRIYQITRGAVFRDDWDLVRQMRRAAVSIMANVAEGFSRYSFKETKQLFIVARASLAELRSHVYVALDQKYIKEQEAGELQEQMAKAGRLVTGLIQNSQRRLDVSATDRGHALYFL